MPTMGMETTWSSSGHTSSGTPLCSCPRSKTVRVRAVSSAARGTAQSTFAEPYRRRLNQCRPISRTANRVLKKGALALSGAAARETISARRSYRCVRVHHESRSMRCTSVHRYV